MLTYVVEFLGTFLFLSVIVATGQPLLIALALLLVILLGGAISGGHFNPAVTLATLWNRGIATDNAVAYIVAQVAAGIAAVTVFNRMKRQGVF